MPNQSSHPGANLSSLILAVLADEPRHGYAIAREIERRSDEALSFGEGTLYPALRVLERDGYIQGAWDRTGDTGRARKVYELTPEGTKQLAKIREEWYAYSRSIDQIMGGRPAPKTA